MSKPKIDVVIYHAPCMDGTAGAYAVKLFNEGHPCEFFGTKPGLEKYNFPDVTGKVVAVVDISFPRETMIELNNKASFLVCLDHHKSAQDQLKDLAFCEFDMKRSGAQMAWDHFPGPLFYPGNCPESATGRPNFIDYIGGRDLWDFSKEGTEEFSAGLFHMTAGWSLEQHFELFDLLVKTNQMNFLNGEWQHTSIIRPKAMQKYNEIMQQGKVCIDIRNKSIDAGCKDAVRCRMSDKHTVWAADSWRCGDRSKVGNILAARDDCDFSVTYAYDLRENVWWISLRSLKEKADVSDVAREYPRGGGHPCAAGFTWTGDIRDLLVPIPEPST